MELARVKISEAGWQALAGDATNGRVKSHETRRVHHVFAADLARPRRRGDRMMGWMAPLRHRRANLVL